MKYPKASFLLQVAATVGLLACVFAPALVAAQTPIDIRQEFGNALNKSGLVSNYDASGSNVLAYGAIASIVNAALGLIGVLTFALVVYAGGMWILAAGNDEKVKQAQGIIKGAVFGLIIIFSAYVIVNFALTQLQKAVGNGGSIQSPDAQDTINQQQGAEDLPPVPGNAS